MSSAINHAQRSHRSEYRKRAFGSGSRRAVLTPAMPKRTVLDMIRGIGRHLKGKSREGIEKQTPSETAVGGE